MPKMLLVPAEPPQEMLTRGSTQVPVAGAFAATVADDVWDAMVPASPNAGKVTREMLEDAARAAWETTNPEGWTGAAREMDWSINGELFVRFTRAAIESLGLEVDDGEGGEQS